MAGLERIDCAMVCGLFGNGMYWHMWCTEYKMIVGIYELTWKNEMFEEPEYQDNHNI